METLEFTETKKETGLVILPDEVRELALRVPETKQKEVQTMLSQIFAGTADWERQVDAIEVKDINDRMSIQLADIARKNVKQARLTGEKLFDAKREAVQQEMQNYKLEDALWLKSKQIMQLKFKAIEEKAEWKAKFVERYEAEQKELRTQLRIEKVSKFIPEVNRIEIENMAEETFSLFLDSIEKTYNDRIAAEKKAEEDRIAKEKADAAEKEAQRLENIRLKAEADKREKEIEAEREETRKANEEKERLADIERKKNAQILADQKAKADKERSELLAKAESERKEKERLAEAEVVRTKSIEAEKRARLIAEKKAKLAPDKDKLLAFMQSINDLPRPEVKSIEAAAIASSVNTLLVKVANYILENANKL
jgi:hypothetical protein